MTVRATALMRSHDGKVWDRGTFEFIELPKAGDRFTIKEYGGAEDDVRVLYIEHTPRRVWADLDPGNPQTSAPGAIIVLEWLTGRADGYESASDPKP
jgi:hypothetical protein